MVDIFLVYQFIKRLVTPFEKWEAFKLGIIDEKGNFLIKRKNFTTLKQQDAMGTFDVMILNLKKLLGKLPLGQTRLATYGAALWLIKEYNQFTDKENLLTEDLSDDIIEYSMEDFKAFLSILFSEEEMMTAGSGQIAGIGIGPDGEPGFTPSQMKKYKKKAKKDFKSFKDMRK